jgi:hypothetical protein
MATDADPQTSPKAATQPAGGPMTVELQLAPETVALIATLAAKLKEQPADVLGDALTFYSAVKEAHDDGGTVIVPTSGLTRTKFSQEIKVR